MAKERIVSGEAAGAVEEQFNLSLRPSLKTCHRIVGLEESGAERNPGHRRYTRPPRSAIKRIAGLLTQRRS